MKGLELSRLYYFDIVKPFIAENFSQLGGKVAAGLAGEGSECYGYDDNDSKDHDWGASVCLWLDEGDFNQYGEELNKALLTLPEEYMGFPVIWTPERRGVIKIQDFYKKYLKKSDKLQTVGEWLGVPEDWLAAASNGEVFEDDLGKFSEIRNDLLLGYPEDIRLKKIAYHCTQIGQSGQYNYPRLVKRGDYVACFVAISEFIREVTIVTFLLNNKYAPFYKWMNRGLKELDILGNEISMYLEKLIKSHDCLTIIEEICELLIHEFCRQGISKSCDFYMGSQAEDIHSHIQLEALKNTSPWVI